MAEQAQSVDERIAGASRARTAALQEASYYRAKLAALESGSTGDIGKLERERAQDLEKKLADALSTKTTLERQVAKLEAEVEHHTEMRASTEERHAAATNRADAAESSYSRALTDYAELQRRAHGHESSIQDHAERAAVLTSSSTQLAAENAHLKEQLAMHEASVSQHLRALEETQLALSAANVRNDEIHSVWEQSQAELTQHQSRAIQLQAELDAKHLESTAAVAKASDLERILKATRDAHQATQVLAAGGLAELISARKETSSRAIPADDGVHAERLRALQEESETIKRLHQETRIKSESTITELDDVRSREVHLQTQVVQLRSEIASLRSQHAQALEEAGRYKSTVVEREAEVRDVARAREAAEVKAGLLRNVMSDHGLSVTDDELATRYPPMTGSETPDQLFRRVQDLEGRLEQRTRAYRELETTHDETRKDLHDKMEHLNGEVHRLRSASPIAAPEDTERAAKAEEELEALRGRHRQLEGTHLKAVQYVKGTEKMLRRMKEVHSDSLILLVLLR
jgi:DNA repair exonuclease SbcCD ATPase subunit